MYNRNTLPLLLAVVVGVSALATDASAQRRGRPSRPGGPAVVGHAVPRVGPPPRVGSQRVYVAPRYISPRILGYAPYRPYYYGYRPGLTVGFYAGYGYPYRYGYPYYPYSSYSYYPYSYSYPYSYGYPYGAYGYPLPPASYYSAVPGVVYGGVRIQGAPPDAQVFADGYYVGIVDDFDGAFQHLNLEAGAHRIEIRPAGLPPIAFDVNVQPGQTITYHAGIR